MRLPSLSDLDREQERIYLNAPLDGVVVIVGPPGSGKTIMALYRASILSESLEKISILMYNKVLSRFVATDATGSASVSAANVQVTTRDKWVYGWWRSAYGTQPPLEDTPTRFRPADWPEISRYALKEQSPERLAKLHWGHLVIDEGQDFARVFYTCLNLIRTRQWKAADPGLTVFADDNQQLDENRNSTTGEIIDALALRDAGRNFVLHKNYRNTKEIGELAKYYRIFQHQADDSPRAGEKPVVRLFKTREEAIETIARQIRTKIGKEVGVIIPDNKKLVRDYFSGLKKELSGSEFSVQAYNSNSKTLTVDSLDFDQANTVTILNMASAKGLEFDIVFIVEMQDMAIDEDKLEAAAKKLYVATSRARESLSLCFSLESTLDPNAATAAPALGLIPPEDQGLCRYHPEERWAAVKQNLQPLKIPRQALKSAEHVATVGEKPEGDTNLDRQNDGGPDCVSNSAGKSQALKSAEHVATAEKKLKALRTKIWEETGTGPDKYGILKKSLLKMYLEHPFTSESEWADLLGEEKDKVHESHKRYLGAIIGILSGLIES